MEATKDQIILREKPHPHRGALFCALGIVAGIGVGSAWAAHHDLVELILFSCFSVYLWACGLYALIQTTITANRRKGTLRVERKLGVLKFDRCYLAKDISQVLDRETPKGYGLRLELCSRKSSRLTLFAEYSSLRGQAAELNQFLGTSRHGLGVSS
jgi:hypothetical protein